NVQMNYWPAEVANMAECHTPLFDLIRSQLDPWRKATAAAAEFNTSATVSRSRPGDPISHETRQKPYPNFNSAMKRGFAIRTSHNILGGMGWKWDKTANAWYCLHLWEHYAFGQDRSYLKKVAYPIMKETCQFWDDQLK